MKGSDIILAMRASQDPERLHQLRRRRLERALGSGVALALGVLLVLLATCA